MGETFGLLLMLAFFGAFGWGLLRLFAGKPGPDVACTVCHHAGAPVLKTRGSMAVEVLLWLCFIIPGLLYSLWRLSTRAKVCASCGSTALVPLTSPMGQKLAEDVKGRYSAP